MFRFAQFLGSEGISVSLSSVDYDPYTQYNYLFKLDGDYVDNQISEKLDPEVQALEKLIEKPDLIIKAANAVKNAKNNTKLLCGAGIVSGEDVSKASELGSQGILVASGIIKAKSWEKMISEFAKSMS